jgi:hypothetical protein
LWSAKALSRKRVHIRTVDHVLHEVWQYRRADRGELDWSDAAAASRILHEIRAAIECSELERRVAALEEAAGDPDWSRQPNGADRYDARH